MGTQASFILKVLMLSGGVSLLIKYGGSGLPIAPTSLNALIAILTPTFILAIALLWRGWNYR
ncbi:MULTISPECIES: hypothetical protein [unclassified Coleofasciculus]|uniref:hypothetical protein n=1 Tax=unclassified Coleofasciculus TaxID=2692782 RepID=UPI00187E57EA|nr:MULTISPECIES: hypothetical protein [unclassified Coleofasciculus]MBE9127060.1 hypothetical protein [Coleofasciculus sp. LEGE 07081]MBE9150448.1 hypothetical protein [Coleofasciculus sp. LEGE 07092]